MWIDRDTIVCVASLCCVALFHIHKFHIFARSVRKQFLLTSLCVIRWMCTRCVKSCVDFCFVSAAFFFLFIWRCCCCLMLFSLRSCVPDTHCVIKMHATHIVRTVISLIWLPARSLCLCLFLLLRTTVEKWFHSWIIYRLCDYMREARVWSYLCVARQHTFTYHFDRNV